MKQTEEVKTKMKVYIAGKIRGDENYKAKFEEAECRLKTLGHSVMNPAVLPSSGFSHGEYMKICFAMLDTCEAVYMLPDWRKSKGAKAEYKFASKKGKVIMFADDGDTKDKFKKEVTKSYRLFNVLYINGKPVTVYGLLFENLQKELKKQTGVDCYRKSFKNISIKDPDAFLLAIEADVKDYFMRRKDRFKKDADLFVRLVEPRFFITELMDRQKKHSYLDLCYWYIQDTLFFTPMSVYIAMEKCVEFKGNKIVLKDGYSVTVSCAYW